MRQQHKSNLPDKNLHRRFEVQIQLDFLLIPSFLTPFIFHKTQYNMHCKYIYFLFMPQTNLVHSKPQALTGQLAFFELEIWESTSTSIISSPFMFHKTQYSMHYKFIPQTNFAHTEPQSLTGRLTLFDFLQYLVHSMLQALTGQLALFKLEI